MFKKYFGIFLAFFMFFGIAFSPAAFATGAGDQSSSPGIPGQKPLSYVGTTLVDGGKDIANATDLPLNPKFKLQFDKNVVNSLFWENNSKCFSMISGSNEKIPIYVTKVDDTIDFSQRQVIFVQPVNRLKPGTDYRLIVSPDLQAKNGVSTLGGTTNGKGVTISFRTAGKVSQPVTTINSSSSQTQASVKNETKNAGSNQQQSSTDGKTAAKDRDTSSKGGSDSTGDKKKTTVSDSNNGNKAGKNNEESLAANQNQEVKSAAAAASDADNTSAGFSATNWVAGIGAVLVIAWVVIEIYIRKKRNNRKYF